MKLIVKSLFATGVLALAAGCSTPSLDELSQTQPAGSEFDQHLAKEYTALAKFEADEMRDVLDAEHYASKGLAAAKGQAAPPDAVWMRSIPAEHLQPLRDAHGRLLQAYDHDVKNLYPMEAAAAQAKFDCWLEQAEENYQPEHIAACRQSYAQAMQTIYAKEQARMSDTKDVSRAADVAPGPETLVFFDFDEATIKSGERGKLDKIASAAEKEGARITAVGHADRAGPESYNQELSMQRAQAIKEALVQRGVSPSAISVEAKGESQPLEQTADDVPEAENRRVQVSIR